MEFDFIREHMVGFLNDAVFHLLGKNKNFSSIIDFYHLASRKLEDKLAQREVPMGI